MLSRRLTSLMVAAVAAAGLTSASFGDFVLTHAISNPGTGTNLGKTVVQFFLTNNGLNGSGTNLTAYELFATVSTGSFSFNQTIDIDSNNDSSGQNAPFSPGDGVLDTNLPGYVGYNNSNGVSTSFSSTGSTTAAFSGTFVRLGTAGQTDSELVTNLTNTATLIYRSDYNDTTAPYTAADQNGNTPNTAMTQVYFNQLSNYTNLSTLHVVTSNTAGGIGDSTANLVLNLVIPTGATVTVTGSAGSPTIGTPAYPVFDTTAVPEPASLGVLALGGLALLARRKKA